MHINVLKCVFSLFESGPLMASDYINNFFVCTSMYLNVCFGLNWWFEKVNKTHVIIEQKMAPPFYDIILNSNKMIDWISIMWKSQNVNKMIEII